MSFVSTAVFVKNLPVWERVVRIVVSAGVVALGLVMLSPPWSWMVAGSAIGFAVTGLVGFCPACALVGRKLDAR